MRNALKIRKVAALGAPQFSMCYSSGAGSFNVGTNNGATSVEVNYGSSYPASTDRTLSFIDLPHQSDRLSLELDGTGLNPSRSRHRSDL